MVEFALILPILLMIVLGIAETALVIQGYLTVQHAAREAARFATTYQPNQGACFDLDGDNKLEDGMFQSDDDDLAPWPYCPKYRAADLEETDEDYYRRRVALIRRRGREAAAGLRIDDTASSDEPGFFHVRVRGYPKAEEGYCEDPDIGYEPWDPSDDQPGCLGHPGLEGVPVEIYIQHNVKILDPLYSQIISRVRVDAEAEMENEGQQVGVEGDFSLDTDPDPPDVTEPTVPPTDEPSPEPTDEPADVSIELSPANATNVLPYTPTHQFVATVTDADSQPIQGAPIGFSIGEDDVGGFNTSGTQKYAEGVTDAQGEISVEVYGHESGSATIRAWVDNDGDDTWDGGPSEPSDTSNKTWTTDAEPYIVVSDYDVFAEDVVQVDVLDHLPDTSYQLLWCVVSGEPTSKAQSITTDGAGGASLDTFEIPEGSDGQYRLETHDAGGDCGADDLVATSTEIHVEMARPDLSISILEPSPPCPETDFTVSVVVENHTAGTPDDNETFDVDLYVDPGSPEGGILPKQWIDDIDSYESITLTFVAWVGSFGTHVIQGQVDASEVVEEEPDWGNWGSVSFSTASEEQCGDGDDLPPWGPGLCQPPGSRECESLLEYGGFEGNVDNVFAHWHVTDGRRPSFKPYEGSSSMRLHASLGSYHPQCPPLHPELYQTVTIPDLTGGCPGTDTMRTTLVVRGQRMVGDSEFACSVPGSVDADDELHVQLSGAPGEPHHRITRGAPLAADLFSGSYAGLLAPFVAEDSPSARDVGTLDFAPVAGASASPDQGWSPSRGALPSREANHADEVRTQGQSSVLPMDQGEEGSRKGLLSLVRSSSEPSVNPVAGTSVALKRDEERADPSVSMQSGLCPIDDDFNDGVFDGQWSTTEVGDADGSVSESGGQLTIDARGDTIWGSSDDFYYVHQSYTGEEFDARLRITDGLGTDQWAKIGLMVRNSTAANSRHAMVMYTRDAGLQFAHRPEDSDGTSRVTDDTSIGLPVWVRIERVNDTFDYYYSTAASPGAGDWIPNGSVTFTVGMGETVQVGIAHASYSDSYAEGSLDEISVCRPLSVDFTGATYSVGEEDGSVEIPVVLDEAVDDTVTVDYATSPGTATPGEDYVETSGTLTFDLNDTEESFSVEILSDSIADGDDTVMLTLSNSSGASIGPISPAMLTIVDDEGVPEVDFSSSSYSVDEDAGAATITATLSLEAEHPVWAEYTLSGGTATAGTDYAESDGGLLFAAGETVKTFEVPIIDDAVVEGDETVDLSLSSREAWLEDFDLSDGTTSDIGSTAWSVDTSECGPGAVFEVRSGAFMACDTDGTETIDGGKVGVWRSEEIDIAGSCDISLDIWSEGHAESDDHLRVYYKLDGGSEVPIAERSANVERETVGVTGLSGSTVQVIVRADSNAGSDNESYHWDSVSVSVGSGPVTVGPKSPATLTILDDDESITVDFSSPSYDVTEDAGLATITATLSQADDDWPIVVGYVSSDGTATAGDDYGSVSGLLTFEPGETVETFDVPIVDDMLIEGAETVNLTLESAFEWLEDFDLSDGTTSDGGGTAWSVDTSECGPGAVFEVRSGAFMASDTDGTGTTVGGKEGVWMSEAIDIARAGAVDVSVDIWSEDTADPDDNVSVYYKLNGGDEVLIAQMYDDFSRKTVSATGLSGNTVQVIVRADLNYDDESYHWDDVTISAGGGSVTVGPNSPATLTIHDDDVPVTVDFSSATYTVTEDVGLATITATLSDVADWTVVAQYASSDETATAGEDYTAVEGIVTFDPGETSQTFTVPITDDLMLEGNEILNLTLQSSSVDWVEDFNLSDGTRSDDGETAWTSSGGGVFEVQGGAFRASNTDAEGTWESEVIDISGAGPVDVTVDIWKGGDPEDHDTLSVYYVLDGGDSVLVADRDGETMSEDGEVVGVTGLSGDTVRVIVRAELSYTGESFYWDNVTVTNGSGPASVGPNSPADLIIVDNDEEPTVSFSSDNYSVAEGDGPAVITATLSAVSGITTTVEYDMQDGTATAGEDYTSTVGTLVFAPGTITQTFEVPIIDDDQFFEGDETVALSLDNPVGAILDPEGRSSTLTIVEDDLPAVDFTAPEYSVDEGVGQAVITVVLNIAFTETVSVNYETVDGSATAPEDYTAVSGTLAFDPGYQTLTFTVPISDDATYEDDETVDLVLSDPTDALVGPNSPAQLIILDNEPVASFTWEPFSVDFTDDVDVTALKGQQVDVRFYGTHDEDEHGTWFYLDNVECEVCTEWPVPEHQSGMATIYGTVEVEGSTRGGVDVWAYDEGAGTTYHTVTLDGGDDLFPEGTYHFYNIPPGTYTIYSECWEAGLLFWDMKEATVDADGEQQVNLNLAW
jgi:hypothetical protein